MQHLAATGLDAVGVDPRAPDDPRLVRSTVEELEPEAPFDAVCAMMSLHHAALDPACEAIARLLRPGGHLFVTELSWERYDDRAASLARRARRLGTVELARRLEGGARRSAHRPGDRRRARAVVPAQRRRGTPVPGADARAPRAGSRRARSGSRTARSRRSAGTGRAPPEPGLRPRTPQLTARCARRRRRRRASPRGSCARRRSPRRGPWRGSRRARARV